jgi:SRSO17 transposase
VYEFAYFLVHAPCDTTVADMVAYAGLRWAVEDDNKAGKDTFGLDGYQVHKWVSWYRHVTCSMLAHAFTAVKRAELGKEHSPGGDHGDGLTRSPVLIHHSLASIRRLLA